jgi:HlyD family secretion protein
MSKKTIYILIGVAVAIIGLLIVLSKTGVIGNKDKGKSVEIANVNTMTIVETVSATEKSNPKSKLKFPPKFQVKLLL